ncbi:MAG TPA: HAMP domain-containing sensor histidine kinase [Solirubrobacteraceae bacterium]|nr:HAMP domain-containing sensor histidine kinase [Solirubrobacteraceae bacterium]
MPARITHAFDRLPIRARLAGVSALLTFSILCAFAVAIGSLTVHRIRSDFNRQVEDTARQLTTELHIRVNPLTYRIEAIQPPLADFVPPGKDAVIRVFTLGGALIEEAPAHAPSLGTPSSRLATVNGYSVASQRAIVGIAGSNEPIGQVIVQYGRSTADTNATIARVELFLVLGVLAGAGFALLAGMMIARRAMAPIAQLTSSAEQIAATRDPSLTLPQPAAHDEVGELAGTLQGMLRELDAARGETEAMLARQRRFVADASHELRTPLTSVLANLELLVDSLHGEEGDAARSALRSSQRMRRLVADLLLLARTDVGRVVAHEPCDLGRIVVEAAAELGPVSDAHEIVIDAGQAPVEGSRDELHRLAINLIENALRHTPPGTEIQVATRRLGDRVELVVQDEGPGVPAEIAPSIFERFVRGAGDRGGSFGLGLAIVQAVAESHGGGVRLEDVLPHGARFVISLPTRTPGAGEGGADGTSAAGPTAAPAPEDQALKPPPPRGAPSAAA